MTSRMKQSSRENKIEEVEKPKASWSEHVWSKYSSYFCFDIHSIIRPIAHLNRFVEDAVLNR